MGAASGEAAGNKCENSKKKKRAQRGMRNEVLGKRRSYQCWRSKGLQIQRGKGSHNGPPFVWRHHGTQGGY